MTHAPHMPGSKEMFDDPSEALSYVARIYEENVSFLRDSFARFSNGRIPEDRIVAHYPYVAITTDKPTQVDTRLSYGFVAGPGRYVTTLTRPDIFRNYYLDQFRQLLKNHKVPLEIGVSDTPIPIQFAFHKGEYIDGAFVSEKGATLPDCFSTVDLEFMDDRVVNREEPLAANGEKPLAFFTAPRVDYSLQRLLHHTGTDPADFQSFVIFTNYQFYIDEFVRRAREGAGHLVEPRAAAGTSTPQMPAYHLKQADGRGVSIVNIGVGPSNARTISDSVAVLRPDAWLMLGHCAGVRRTQKKGDYVLAHAYVRDDHVLNDELPVWIPVPALAEMQIALQQAVAEVTGLDKNDPTFGYLLKSYMRTGTVISTNNRNWEISNRAKYIKMINQSRAIAVDMESAAIAANGFRMGVPYGTLLCVSDRPLHGEIKLPGMASDFYRNQVGQHLEIGLQAIKILRESGLDTLHSRKLRSYAEVAFR